MWLWLFIMYMVCSAILLDSIVEKYPMVCFFGFFVCAAIGSVWAIALMKGSL